FVPFVTDYVWGVLRRAGAPESVHLASWPAFDAALIDAELSAQMALARRLVELGRSARSAASVRTRQPLRRALIGAAGFDAARDAELAEALTEHTALIAGEVLVVEFGPAEAAWLSGVSGAEPVPADVREHADDELALRFWLRRV